MFDNPEFQVEPKYLTAEQCAVRFAISLRHFKYLVAAGEMPPPVRFGKSARWAVDMLQEFEAEKMRAFRTNGQVSPGKRKKGK